jgi:hypothetical protein
MLLLLLLLPPLQTIISKVKTYHKVFQAFVTNAKLELTVLVTLQVRGGSHYDKS